MTSGQVVTFYSYKGGAGRSFALANVAALLAQWGYRVLCVDWDLEAPGLSYYFKAPENRHGLLELVEQISRGSIPTGLEVIQTINIEPDATLALITAGSQDSTYARRVQAIDWQHMYERNNLGNILESWRTEWMRRYDVVLIDSRTGITDIGGICTAQMPDVLMLFFTANLQSVNGVLEVFDQAITSRNKLVLDRPRLLAIPVPSRFDQAVEYERSERWRERFLHDFARCYRDWAAERTPLDVLLGHCTIFYSAYWSFGEELPVLSESQREPSFISYRFATLAALLAHRLENSDVLASSRDSYVDSAAKAGKRRGRFKFDIFISQTRKTAHLANQLTELLSLDGLRVMTSAEPKAGVSWTDELQQELDDSRHVILLLGDELTAFQEREALYVLRQAIDGDSSRRVIPILTSPISKRSMPGILASLQSYDLSNTSVEEVASRITRSLL